MKKEYMEPEMELLRFRLLDVLTTSDDWDGEDDDTDTPYVPPTVPLP